MIDTAIQLAAAATALRERLVLARDPRAELRWSASLVEFKARLGDSAKVDGAWAEGRAWEVDEAMTAALSIPPKTTAAA